MMRQARASGLKRRHPTPASRPSQRPSPAQGNATHPAIAPPLSLPPTSLKFVSPISTFVAPHSPLLSPPPDFTPPSSHKHMRRSASPHFLLDDRFSFHTLLSLRDPSPVTSASASPLPPSFVSDHGVTVSSEDDNAVPIVPIPAEANVSEVPQASATSPPSHPPSTTSNPHTWTLAEIIERGLHQHWGEQEYKLHRPSGFTGLQDQSWARLDAAIRRRRHDHETETWELSFTRVCHNLRRSHDQKVAESSGDNNSENGGDTDSTTRGAALSSLVHHELNRMKREHKALMDQFEEDCRTLVMKITARSEIEQ